MALWQTWVLISTVNLISDAPIPLHSVARLWSACQSPNAPPTDEASVKDAFSRLSSDRPLQVGTDLSNVLSVSIIWPCYSAGVGRTGTVILCDICLRMAAHEGYVDVYAVLDYLRSRRCNMVHNVEQYRLAHLIILNCLANDQMPTVVPVSRNFKRDLKQLLPGIDAEWDYINKCQWQDDAMVEARFLKGMDADNLTRTDGKDRFSHIKPGSYATF